MTLYDFKGLQVGITNMCTLGCPACSRTTFQEKFPKKWKNINLKLDDFRNFIDVSIKEKIIKLCGNNGDAIYHPEIFEYIDYLKTEGAHIEIYTNGSHKTSQWWQELCSRLDDNDWIHFAIDGTPENFTQYRINGDWESIKIGINESVKSRCKVTWVYIPFKFNESVIEDARSLALDLGVDKFTINKSSRDFDGNTMSEMIPSPELLNNRALARMRNVNDIDPLCQDHQHHYISEEGFYSPCCMLSDYNFYYKTDYYKNQKEYDIRRVKLSEILKKQQGFSKNVIENPQPGCSFLCPKNHQDPELNQG